MFTWLNKQGVKSDKGFEVQSVGRFTIEYREHQKCISVQVNTDRHVNGKFFERVKASAFNKWDDGTPIDKIKQKQILQNFIDAMEFQGIGIIVEE